MSRILTPEELKDVGWEGRASLFTFRDILDSHEALRAERDALRASEGLHRNFAGECTVLEEANARLRAERDAALEKARIANNVVCWGVDCVHQAAALDIAAKAQEEKDAAIARAEKAEAEREALKARLKACESIVSNAGCLLGPIAAYGLADISPPAFEACCRMLARDIEAYGLPRLTIPRSTKGGVK